MGFFSKFFHKDESKSGSQAAVPGSQPHRDWPWTLNLSGYPSSQISWDIIAAELRELNLEDPDSFLILEQKDPQDPQNYWFIQSAVNRAGPHPGWYTVEVGWGSEQGMGLRDRDIRTVEEVIPFFRAAYDRKAVDLSGFEDMSGMLG